MSDSQKNKKVTGGTAGPLAKAVNAISLWGEPTSANGLDWYGMIESFEAQAQERGQALLPIDTRPVAEYGEMAEDSLTPNFASEFSRFDSLLDDIWGTIGPGEGGCLWLQSAPGMGKTWTINAIEAEARTHNALVIRFDHGEDGHGVDFNPDHLHARIRTVIAKAGEAAGQVSEVEAKLPAVYSLAGSRQAILACLADLDALRGERQVILVLDGVLDSWVPFARDCEAESSFLDAIPKISEIPTGCWLLVTTPGNTASARAEATALKHSRFHRLTLHADDPDYAAAVEQYLAKNLPTELRAADDVQLVLELCRGSFRAASHWCQGLQALACSKDRGKLGEYSSLSPGERRQWLESGSWYGSSLQLWKQRMGEEDFNHECLPILLVLAAAKTPLSLLQMEAFGVDGTFAEPPEWMKEFLLLTNAADDPDRLVPDGELFSLAHEALRSFLEKDPCFGPLLSCSHRMLTNCFRGLLKDDWEDDLSDSPGDAHAYAARFWPDHLRARGDRRGAKSIAARVAYARYCAFWAYSAFEGAYYNLSIQLYERAVAGFRAALSRKDSADMRSKLADVLMKLGVALSENGCADRGLVCHQEAIVLQRTLLASSPTILEADFAQFERYIHLLLNQAVDLHELGKNDESCARSQQAIALVREKLERGWSAGTARLLVDLLSNYICDLKYDDPETARALGVEGVELGERLIQKSNARANRELLRRALFSLANVLQPGGEETPAEDNQAVIDLYDRMIDLCRQDRGADTALDLAEALSYRSSVHRDLASFEEAEADLEESLGILARCPCGDEVRDLFASVYGRKGILFYEQTRYHESLQWHEKAVQIFQRKVEAGDGSQGAVQALAGALMNKGNTLAALAEVDPVTYAEPALACYEQATSTFEQMVEESGRENLRGYLIGVRRMHTRLLDVLEGNSV